jgi:pimeloyl-ACP methyl ester carboxylesterase
MEFRPTVARFTEIATTLLANSKDKRVKDCLVAASILALVAAKKRAAAALVLAAYLYKRHGGSSGDELLKFGAEARLYAKYFSSDLSIVTLRNKNATTALSLTAIAKRSASTRHVVFVSSSGQPALFAPVMANLLVREQGSLVVHACDLQSGAEASESFSKWIRRDLRAEDGERVVIVAHGAPSCGSLAKLVRGAPELAGKVVCVFLNPLAGTGSGLAPLLPLKQLFLSQYASLLAGAIRGVRVMHERVAPLVDASVLEYGLISARAHAVETIEVGTLFPTEVALICGDQDWSCGNLKYVEMSEALGGSRPVHLLRGLSGFPHLEDPEQVGSALLAVLELKQ